MKSYGLSGSEIEENAVMQKEISAVEKTFDIYMDGMTYFHTSNQ